MFHFISPFTYALFVKSFSLINTCPNNSLMIKIRKIHNINLSILSTVMLLGFTFANYKDNKIYPLHNLLCKPYSNDNNYAFIFSKLFLYSKYLEWLDSLFLHLSNKEISQLQYTHHMSTAILVYINSYTGIESYVYIPLSLNCFVHIFMYWYFAYPKGALLKFRKIITISQLIQHIAVVYTAIYVRYLDNCKINNYSNIITIMLYSMYFYFFSMFYIFTYFKKKVNPKINIKYK
tara:strand:- start:1138 stop:1839 length:702 start_codon:yes stop_codon:yes gene_type:complete